MSLVSLSIGSVHVEIEIMRASPGSTGNSRFTTDEVTGQWALTGNHEGCSAQIRASIPGLHYAALVYQRTDLRHCLREVRKSLFCGMQTHHNCDGGDGD